MNRMIMVVRRDEKGRTHDPQWIDVESIKMLRTETNFKKGTSQTVFYTDIGEFVPCNNSEQMIFLLEEIDGFMKSDRGMLGNLKNEVIINENDLTIHFPKINNYITATAGRFKTIKKYIEDKFK